LSAETLGTIWHSRGGSGMSPSPMGGKNGLSLTGWKIQSFRLKGPEKNY
jgi:hypothetical protein